MDEDQEQAPPEVTCSGSVSLRLRTAPEAPQDEEAAGDGN